MVRGALTRAKPGEKEQQNSIRKTHNPRQTSLAFAKSHVPQLYFPASLLLRADASNSLTGRSMLDAYASRTISLHSYVVVLSHNGLPSPQVFHVIGGVCRVALLLSANVRCFVVLSKCSPVPCSWTFLVNTATTSAVSWKETPVPFCRD